MELPEFKMAELGPCAFWGSLLPFFFTFPLSLNLMRKTKSNLIRIICLINLVFNIQAGSPPPLYFLKVSWEEC